MIAIPLIVGLCIHERKLTEVSSVESSILILLLITLAAASSFWFCAMRSGMFTTSFDEGQLFAHDGTDRENDYPERYRMFREHLRASVTQAMSQGSDIARWRGYCLTTALVAFMLALSLFLLTINNMSPKKPGGGDRPVPAPQQQLPTPETKPAPAKPLPPQDLRESYDGPIQTDRNPTKK